LKIWIQTEAPLTNSVEFTGHTINFYIFVIYARNSVSRGEASPTKVGLFQWRF